MFGRARWIVMIAVAAALLGAAAPARADKWALLVGINGYRNVTPLRYSVSDVTAMQDLLVSQCGYRADHVYVMTDDSKGEEAPTHNNILFLFGQLADRLGTEDSFLFYFSGHGMEAGGRQYLLAINADPRNVETLEATAVPLSKLREKSAQMKAKHVIFLLDACRNNPRPGMGESANALGEGMAKMVQVVARAGAAGAEGSAVLFSCKQGERAYEWAAKEHSIFGYYLLRGLSGEAADPQTGDIMVWGLADYLQRMVPPASQQVTGEEAQHPWLATEGAARIVLATVRPPAPPEAVKEIPTIATLTVSSEPPGARVLVDGNAVGITPCEHKVDLGADQSREVAVSLEKEGYFSKAAQVTLYRGRTTPWESVRLEPVPAPAPPAQRPGPLPLPDTGRVFRGPSPPSDARKGDTWVSPADGKEMVFVPAGEFLMGSPESESDTGEDEHPQRSVYVDAFWIDKTEVTVAQYRRFCQTTGRRMPDAPNWGWRDDHPMVNLTWFEAVAYAQWAGKRLPTEAEWEKAARGTDGWRFPWGYVYDFGRCVYNTTSTQPVGGHPEGMSPYGCLDMAGNVQEWCEDWYQGDYYRSGPLWDPKGPTSGQFRVMRGGSWWGGRMGCASRNHNPPDAGDDTFGFRCARGPQ